MPPMYNQDEFVVLIEPQGSRSNTAQAESILRFEATGSRDEVLNQVRRLCQTNGETPLDRSIIKNPQMVQDQYQRFQKTLENNQGYNGSTTGQTVQKLRISLLEEVSSEQVAPLNGNWTRSSTSR